MIALLTTLCLLNFKPNPSYDFPVGTDAKFNVKVQFDGYLPLFGGKVGKADVDMVVRALGVASEKLDEQAVDSEIIELKAVAFGSSLPLNKNNIGTFFPRAVATIELDGTVTHNNAAEVMMPVKLPGLDSRRLPEISYVPLVINRKAALDGTSYEFTRTFNGSPMKYMVTPGKMDDAQQEFTIYISQESESVEDAYGNPLPKEAKTGVRSMLKTVLTGKGTATFNFAKRMFDKVIVETTGDSNVTDIKTGKTSKRSLKTTLTIVRDGAKIDK